MNFAAVPHRGRNQLPAPSESAHSLRASSGFRASRGPADELRGAARLPGTTRPDTTVAGKVHRRGVDRGLCAAEIQPWDTGEAELITIRRTGDHTVNKHYDLTDQAGLDELFDEFIAMPLMTPAGGAGPPG
jgi:hypothetical protein